MEEVAARGTIRVDYPRFNEMVAPGDYTVRIDSPGGKPVEVSIDDGPWQDCRPSVGYWWFDWMAGRPGRHKLAARMAGGGDGRSCRTKSRYFRVGTVSDAGPARNKKGGRPAPRRKHGARAPL
ncbi:MAG: hypothetical protein ABII00_03690 [Elusimicrobiota bacterium]